MATVHACSSPNLMPGSYFNIDHSAAHTRHESIYNPPAPSPRPRSANKPANHRSRSSRSISSIPRPVSRSDKDGEGVRKRPRLDDYSYPSSRTTISSGLSTPRPESRLDRKLYKCGLDGESEHDLSYFSAANSARSRDATSPLLFVNTAYRLAGGLDTPGASFERHQEEWADRQEELDWRVNRYTNPDDAGVRRRNLPRTPSSTFGQKRSLEESPVFGTPAEFQSQDAAYTASGWHIRSRAWAMTGGLAYKAINFCLSTAFRGFSAGGGQSFAMDIGTPEISSQGFRVSQVNASEDVFSNKYEKQEKVPGGFPEHGLTEDYFSRKVYDKGLERDTATPTLQGQDEMRNDWLMVDRPTTTRRGSRASVAGSRRNSYRQASSRANVGTTSGASFASPRPRASISHTRQTSNNSLHLSPQINRPSLATNPPLGRDAPVSQISPTNRKSVQPQSSAVSPDVMRFEKRMRKKARQEDESMSRMNAHLQDLIRQGKEALGSKVSIEDDDDNDHDEGFYEDGSDDNYQPRLSSSRVW